MYSSFSFSDFYQKSPHLLAVHAQSDIIRVTCTSLAVDKTSRDRKSTRLNSSHQIISYAVFCLKKKNEIHLFGHQEQFSQVSAPRKAIAQVAADLVGRRCGGTCATCSVWAVSQSTCIRLGDCMR